MTRPETNSGAVLTDVLLEHVSPAVFTALTQHAYSVFAVIPVTVPCWVPLVMFVSCTSVPPGDTQLDAAVFVLQIIVYVSSGFPTAPSTHVNGTDVLPAMPDETDVGAPAAINVVSTVGADEHTSPRSFDAFTQQLYVVFEVRPVTSAIPTPRAIPVTFTPASVQVVEPEPSTQVTVYVSSGFPLAPSSHVTLADCVCTEELPTLLGAPGSIHVVSCAGPMPSQEVPTGLIALT
jgi:hypothetical protein